MSTAPCTTARPRASSPIRSGPGWRTGRAPWRRTTTRWNACSGSPTTGRETRGRRAAARDRPPGWLRGELPHLARRGLPGRAGQARGRPLLRRRRPCPQRLRLLGRVHDRLPQQRQEHAHQELPLVRGAPGRGDHPRADGRGHPPARGRRTAATAMRSPASAPDRGGADARSTPHAAWCSRQGRWGPTRCCSAAGCRARCPGSPGVSATSSGPTRSRWSLSPRRRAARTSRAAWRSARASIPRPDVHAEPVIYGRRGDGIRMLFTVPNERGSRATRPLHFALGGAAAPGGMRWDAASRRLVAQDGDPAGDAGDRQLDHAEAEAADAGRHGLADDRARPRQAAAEADPGRLRARAQARRADRRNGAGLPVRVRPRHPRQRAHPGRRRDRRRAPRRA